MSTDAVRLVLQFLVIPSIVLIAAVMLYVIVRYRAAISTAATMIANSSDRRQRLDSGVSINLLGSQFVRVGALYNKMSEERLLSVDEVRKWTIFAEHFKTAFHDAVEIWKDALKAQRRDLIQRAIKAFDDLVVPLTDFEAQAYKRLTSPSPSSSPPSSPAP